MRRLIALAFALTFAAIATSASAQTTVTGSMSMILVGWNGDTFTIVTDTPIENPAGCSRPDGYTTHISHGGYKTYVAAALTAYAMRQRIRIVVDDAQCFDTRPKIIGIYLQPDL